MLSNSIFLLFLLATTVISSPFTQCNYRGRMVENSCECLPEFSGEKCEHRLTHDETLALVQKQSSVPSYNNLGPKNCVKGVGCEYDVNWDLGFATVTYYGAGCNDPNATTGKCGTACRKGSNAQYTAAIPLAYWPPIRYGNCPKCGLDCLWDQNVLQNGQHLCFELTPYYPIASGLPNRMGSGKPIIVQVTDSCGGNCPPGPPLSKGSCNGSSSPDCGNAALYEGIQNPPQIPYKIYVGDDYTRPNAAGQGYRCLDAWQCNLFGTKYWSPCTVGGLSVSSPGFLDWCAGGNMHIDVNTEALQDPMVEFCKGVAFPGNDASCIAKYKRVDCGTVQTKPNKFARGYSHWDNVNGRNVWCCQPQSWGAHDTCEQAAEGLPFCADTKTGDCFSPVC